MPQVLKIYGRKLAHHIQQQSKATQQVEQAWDAYALTSTSSNGSWRADGAADP